jgi:hypothetical protein
MTTYFAFSITFLNNLNHEEGGREGEIKRERERSESEGVMRDNTF